MFSGSSSYLGGANNARPGQPPYGQQQQYQQQQQQPTGFGSLAPQATGYGQAPLQQQYTGFPGQTQGQAPQQQPMYTGYGGQGNQAYGQQQQQQPPVPSIPQQFQYQAGQPTGQQALQPPQPQRPQPTGMTSSQMANSFRSSTSQPAPSASTPTKSSKIPNIRLSFITAQDQAKFEQLFKSATGNAQALSGDAAKDILLRSRLDGDALGHIW